MNCSMIKRICGINYYSMKKEDKLEAIKELVEFNLIVERKLAAVLIIINIILLYFDIKKFLWLWPESKAYENLFHLHIIILIVLSIFLLFENLRNRYFCKMNLIFDQLLCEGILFLMLIWCALISINAQLIHGQISALIICAFCIATTTVSTPINSLIRYLFSIIIFVTGIIRIQVNFQEISGNIVNSCFLIVLVIVISNVNFSNFINDFKNRRIILDKTQQLEKFNKDLETTLKKRSKKLKEINKNLINEIKKRHEIEMEALKSRLAFEEEKSILDEKIEYENLRTEFFANLSHELRTPLNVIFSAQQILTLILKDSVSNEKNEKVNKYLGLIKQNCYRLIRLIGNLIDITKIDVGNLKMNLSNHDIVKLIVDITLSVNDYVIDKGLNLNINCDIKEKIIACDADKIERIMLNLLSNAIKFTQPDGSIHVDIKEKNDKVVVSVKDNGVGIPTEMKETIFDRFVQVDKSIIKKKQGSGIGLSLVKALIEMHGGNILVECDEGKGSKFIFEIPIITIDDRNSNLKEIACANHEKVEKINIEFSDIYF